MTLELKMEKTDQVGGLRKTLTVFLQVIVAMIALGYVAYTTYEIQMLKLIVQNHEDYRFLERDVNSDHQHQQQHTVSRDKRETGFRAPSEIRLQEPLDATPEPKIQKDIGGRLVPDRASYVVPSTDSMGSVYTRWGKFACGGTSNGILYSGYAAAAPPIKGYGGSTEIQCVPLESGHHHKLSNTIFSRSQLAPVKFNLGSHTGFMPPMAHNAIVECAVCSTRKANTIMIPGWYNKCPSTWITEYKGYLMSTPGLSRRYYFSSNTYCVDENPDTTHRAFGSTRRLQLTFLQIGQCSAGEPCNNYKTRNLIGCTVCSRPSE